MLACDQEMFSDEAHSNYKIYTVLKRMTEIVAVIAVTLCNA